MITGKKILNDLKRVRWETALRTYGSDHSTLIGLLVDWWISGDTTHRWAIEAGPAYEKNKGLAGRCDALLCLNKDPVGVLEVEGSQYEFAAEKLGYFFDGKLEEYRSLKFGVLLLYPTKASPAARGKRRQFPNAFDKKAIKQVTHITNRHPKKPIIVITLDKISTRSSGILSKNFPYSGLPSKIKGYLYENGKQIKSVDFATTSHPSGGL
jgi:hypothetical protein